MAKARGKYANMMLIDADTGPIGAGDASPAVGGGSSTVKLTAGADIVVMGDGLMVGRRGTRVLRFPVDASALLSEYPFTEGGVEAALAEASPGDVVSLPVGVLAGDYEIPADVTVAGMGLNTVLTGTITGDGLLLNVQRSIDYANQIISTADHVYLGTTVMRDLDPDGDNLWRLGDDGLRWAQAWINYLDAQDVTIAATLDVGGTTYAADMLPQETDAYDLGSASRLWRTGYLSELRALLFAEETIQLVGGWLIIPKDAGTFAADVADDDDTIDFGKAVTPGHWVLVRSYDASTGMPAAEFITVGALDTGTTYHVTRDVDGSGANDWAAGTPFLVLGEEGDGRIELNAYDTPRIQILQQGDAYNLSDEIVRIGDLNGSFGVSEERYGFGVGDYAGGNYFSYDPTSGFLLRAGDGEVRIDETGITIGYDAAAAFRLEADAGGTKYDVMYHDADADALHLESATQYWELAEYQGAKWAMDGDFVKGQARPGSTAMTLALGDASQNWAALKGFTGGQGPGLRIQMDDDPGDYDRSMDAELVGHYTSDANADPPASYTRVTPQVTFVSVDVPPSSTCLFLQGVKYLGVALYVFNVTDGKAQGHVFTELGWQGYDYVSVYSTNDTGKVGDTTGECYVRLYENDTGSNRYAGDAILRNGNASKTMRFVGWVTYMTA